MYVGMCCCLQMTLLVRSVRDDVAENGLPADVVKKERDVADRNVYGIGRSDMIRDFARIVPYSQSVGVRGLQEVLR